jgi:hypothetical protein
MPVPEIDRRTAEEVHRDQMHQTRNFAPIDLRSTDEIARDREATIAAARVQRVELASVSLPFDAMLTVAFKWVAAVTIASLVIVGPIALVLWFVLG